MVIDECLPVVPTTSTLLIRVCNGFGRKTIDPEDAEDDTGPAGP